jgi:hypothetical protein
MQVHILGGDDAAEVLVDVVEIQSGHKKRTAIPSEKGWLRVPGFRESRAAQNNLFPEPWHP